jgi:hypothetical protein
MGQTSNYADILTRVMRDEEQYQPLHGPKIVSVCDAATGQFMLVAVGRQGQRRVDNIVFHAQLVDGHVIIETDMTEEGLRPALIEAGIRAEDILTGKEAEGIESAPLAA